MSDYRANCDESVKMQEKEWDTKRKPNFKANHGKSVRNQEKELDSKCKQNYRANCDEYFKAQEKEDSKWKQSPMYLQKIKITRQIQNVSEITGVTLKNMLKKR